MRRLSVLFLIVVGLLSSTAYADILYQFTLIPDVDLGYTVGGTGSVLLSDAPPITGSQYDQTLYAAPGTDPTDPHVLEAVSFNIYGHTYTLSSPTAFTNHFFYIFFDGTGAIQQFVYDSSAEDGNPDHPFVYDFSIGSTTYFFQQRIGDGNPPSGGYVDSFGILAINDIETIPPVSTPEPSSFVLFGTGVLASLAAVRHRLA